MYAYTAHMTQTTTETAQRRLRTVAEACEQLGIGRTTFYDLVNKGELPVYDLSGSGRDPGVAKKGERRRMVRVDQTDIDAFIERSRVP